MKQGMSIVLAILSAVLGLVAPAAASAADGGGALLVFHPPATNGYRVVVIAGARRSGAGEVLIFVASRHAEVTYTAPATVTITSFEADLGLVGRIAMRAEPSDREATAHSQCDRHPVRYEPVAYVGEFELHGEGGYTKASATRLPVLFDEVLNLVCGEGIVEGHEGGADLPGAGLGVGKGGSGLHVGFRVHTNGPGKHVAVRASISERRGDLRIHRAVGFDFPSSVFSYASTLSHASLAPPAPFSGRAVFRRFATPANRWTGNLRLDFPGRPGVALTGRRFTASLVRGHWEGPTAVSSRSDRPNLSRWPSTKPWPTASATSSPPGPS